MKKISIILILFLLLGCASNEIRKSEIEKTRETKEEYYILKGINYERKGQYTKALKEYEKAYSINKNNIITLKETAGVYAKLKDYDKGIFYYKRALEIDEKDYESIRNIGYLWYLKNDYEKSLKYLNEIPDSEKDIEILKLYSYLLYKTGRLKKSYEIFQKVLNHENIFDTVYYKEYVNLLDDLDKKDEIKIFLEINLEKNNSSKDYVVFYSENIIKYFGEYSSAEKELKRYIVSYGGSDEVYMTLAELFYKKREYKKSKEVLKFVSYRKKYNEEYLYLKERLENNNEL